MPGRSPAWIVLADARRAKLLRCRWAWGRRTHLEAQADLTFDWQGHEHGRPMPLMGKTGNTYAAGHHDEEESLRRFAKEICHWLMQRQREHRFGRLTLFAPTRFVAELRRQMPADLDSLIDYRENDLINFPSQQLHQHPAIRQTVGL